MNSPIDICIKWAFGSAKRVTALPCDTLEDVLARCALVETEDTKIDAVFMGKVLDIRMSLNYYHMESGSTLVALFREKHIISIKRKSCRPISEGPKKTDTSLVNRIQKAKESEYSRLTDIAYTTWEMVPKGGLFLLNMYNSQNSKSSSQSDANTTKIASSPIEIRDEPLPNCFAGAERKIQSRQYSYDI